MDSQQICIHSGSGRVGKSNVEIGTSPTVHGLLGTLFNLSIGFAAGSGYVALAAETTGTLTIKEKGKPNSAPLILALEWTITGTGAATRYNFSVLMDSEELRAMIADAAEVEATMQITWQLAAEDQPRNSWPLTIRILNTYSQPGDGLPSATLIGAWPWLKARLPAGILISEDAKTITQPIAIVADIIASGVLIEDGPIGGYACTLPKAFKLIDAFLTFASDTTGGAVFTQVKLMRRAAGEITTEVITEIAEAAINNGVVQIYDNAVGYALAAGNAITVSVTDFIPGYEGEIEGLQLWLRGYFTA